MKESTAKPVKAAAKKASGEGEASLAPAPVGSNLEDNPSDEMDPAPMEVEEPETPLSELDEPEPASLSIPPAGKSMPRIKLKMSKPSTDSPIPPDVNATLVSQVQTTSDGHGEENGSQAETNGTRSQASTPARPRRAAARQQAPASPAATRPVRSNARARAAAKPASPATPVTRTLRSRRGDRTEGDLQKEREKAEAIRAALNSEDENEDDIEENL